MNATEKKELMGKYAKKLENAIKKLWCLDRNNKKTNKEIWKHPNKYRV